MSERENMVTIRLTAAAYAVLLQELQFAACVGDHRDVVHSRANAEALLEALFNQGKMSTPDDPKEAA